MNSEEQKKSSSGTETTDQEGLIDQAKHVMSAVADKVGEEVNHQIDVRRDTAVKKIGGVAQAIRWGSGLLKDVGPLGDVSTKAADGVDDVANFFENKQIGDVIRDVERFARREPALFIGGSLALGLIAGRFLKSSTPHEAELAGDDDADEYEAPMGGYRAYRDQDFGYGEGGYLASENLEDHESRRYGMGRGASSSRSGPTTSRTGSVGSMGSRPVARAVPAPMPPRAPQATTPSTTAASATTPSTGSIKPSPIVNAGSGSTSATQTAPMKPIERNQSQTPSTSLTDNKPSNGIAGR